MRGATNNVLDQYFPLHEFQSTLLMRGATTATTAMIRNGHFNPRSSCEERRASVQRGQLHHRISIHAPHARSDQKKRVCTHARQSYFNPRSSCEERRDLKVERLVLRHFNPRSSCEERPDHCKGIAVAVIFQSTLLMRGATWFSAYVKKPSLFQSTLLMRGATRRRALAHLPVDISIHAPHARSDDPLYYTADEIEEFQSTLLMRGATRTRNLPADDPEFQSTLLMRGATRAPAQQSPVTRHFNPRSSCEERPPLRVAEATWTDISIHAPHARSDEHSCAGQQLQRISIHAPHARSDGRSASRSITRSHFNPRSSCEERPCSHSDKPQVAVDFNPRSSCEERPVPLSIVTPFQALFQSTLLMRGATQRARISCSI